VALQEEVEKPETDGDGNVFKSAAELAREEREKRGARTNQTVEVRRARLVGSGPFFVSFERNRL
jgi:hypothetical protein